MAGPQPIQISEIAALFDLTGVTERREKARYAHLIQELDRVFLEHAAEKAEELRRKAKT